VSQRSNGKYVPLVAVAVLGAVALGFWSPCLFFGRVPATVEHQSWMVPWRGAQPPEIVGRQWDPLLWDSVAQFYPWRVLLRRGLREGELPLWSPYQYCGYPLVGNGQSGVFYPLNWLLLILPTAKFLGISLALHLFIAGLLTFYFCRLLRLSVLPALFAALAFSYGGFMITWALLPTLVASAVWLPGALAGIELTQRRRRCWGTVLLAISLGLTLLAGHMQVAAYVWMVAGVYALGRLLYNLWRKEAVTWWPVLAGAGLGLMLGMAQVLPTVELGVNSPRGSQVPTEQGWQFQQHRFLRLFELITLVSPDALGTPASSSLEDQYWGTKFGIVYSEHCGFAGVVTLLLALIAVVYRRDRISWAFACAALVVLSVIMGGPLARMLYFWVPKVGVMGSFTRLLFVYIFLVAVLGALGLDHLMSRTCATSRLGRAASYLLGIGFAVVLLAELLPWAWRFVPMQPAGDLYRQTELTRQIQKRCDPTEGRVLAITPRRAWSLLRTPPAVLPPNSATVYGYLSPQGYDSLSIDDYYKFAAKLEHEPPAPVENGNMMLLENYASPLLCDVAVKWIVSREPLRGDDLKLLWQGEGAYLYRAQCASRFRVRNLAGKAIEPSAVNTGLNYVEVQLPPVNGGTLLVADTWYPGWRCFVDGRPAGPGRCGVFRRLELTGGAQSVFMAYYPTTVVCGLFLSLLVIGLLAAVITGYWTVTRKN